MPLLTTVIDDKSPLIAYDSTWLPGTSQDDNFAVDYYLGTFQKNNAPDGTATFNFNGTTLWVYGANRPNHGRYTVLVDGTHQSTTNGSGNNLFQQILYSTTVSQGMHTMTLQNTDGANGNYVDIDMIVWQSEVGNAGDQLVPEIVQDTDPRFQYQGSAWATTLSNSNITLNLFNNGTGHVAQTSGETVSFTFTDIIGHAFAGDIVVLQANGPLGEAVTLFGTSGPSNGPYSVQLDGSQSEQYNANNAYPTSYGTTIYHADNLGPGSHQLVLTNLPDQSGQYLSIDYAQLWAVASSFDPSSSSNVTTCPPILDNSVSAGGLGSGVIAGLVVEGVVALMAAAAALFFYLRWKAVLAAPASYTPFYQPPGTTMWTGTGTGPSLDGTSPNSPPNNASSPPIITAWSSYQQPKNSRPVQNLGITHSTSNSFDSRAVSEGATSSNTGGRARRPLLRGPGEGSSYLDKNPNTRSSPAGQRESVLDDAISLPPGYNTAVHGADV